MTYPLPQKLMSGLISSLFASLPAAAAVPGQQYFVSDVGIHGSNWQSDGTAWQLVGGQVVLFQSSLPVGIPPSGTIASNGALTLGTALDNVYPSIYMWFPAGAWTGSTAGMYYVTMTSTTVGQVYTNQYLGGVPSIPLSPTAVTTGAGAYTQTTGTYLTVLSYTMPANIMGAGGRVTANVFTSNYSSANSKYVAPTQPFSSGQAAYSTTVAQCLIANGVVQNVNLSRQICSAQTNATAGTYPSIATINTASPVNVTPQLYLTTATDWIVLQSYQLTLSR